MGRGFRADAVSLLAGHLRLVTLDIADASAYARYRAGMEPLLAEHGGAFVLDVEGTVHRSPGPAGAGRALLIRFPTDAAAAAFFQDTRYREVRAAHFAPAVRATQAWIRASVEAPDGG